MKKRKLPTPEERVRLLAEKEDMNLNLHIKKVLKDFAKADAAACGLTLRAYFEKLIERRRNEAGPVAKRTMDI
jgi:N-dimethylarginine dimethylaminohydrolase